MCRMTSSPSDPAEQIRRELARALAPLALSIQEVTRADSPTARLAAGLQEAARRTRTAQADLRAFAAWELQLREAQDGIARQIVAARRDYDRAAEQLARIGSSIAVAATVRAVADPTTSPEQSSAAEPHPGTGHFSEADVRHIVAAALREVTGDRPEGWRWLFCTPVGIATFTGILIAAASLVVACVQLANSSPTVKIENSPGATVYVQTEDGEAGQGQAVTPTTTEPREDAGVDDRDLDE